MHSLPCNSPTSHVLASVMYECRVSSNVLMRVPSYVQRGQLVQSLKWGWGRGRGERKGQAETQPSTHFSSPQYTPINCCQELIIDVQVQIVRPQTLNLTPPKILHTCSLTVTRMQLVCKFVSTYTSSLINIPDLNIKYYHHKCFP